MLIKSIKVIDRQSPFHNQEIDLTLSNGVYHINSTSVDHNMPMVNGKGLILTPGWCDMWSHFNDPGDEHKEDLRSGINTALAGGYTDVALLPNTNPVIQSKSDIAYLKYRTAGYPIEISPLVAASVDCKGEELSEMIDARMSGAVAFTDGLNPLWHTDLFLKALIYMQKFDGLLINRPQEKWLSQYGTMHEGFVSTVLGLKGIPSVAEEIMIQRDLKLLEYAGQGKLHFACISTLNGVELIRQAKRKGFDVTCSVSIWNLLYTDEVLEDYDTSFKVDPPIRATEDRDALISGILDNTIDVIVAAHIPHDQESKKLEYDLADFGAIGLQTTLPALMRLQEFIPLELLITKVTSSPRNVLSLETAKIDDQAAVNCCILDPELTWEFNDQTNMSKSVASPFFNTELKGKVLGVHRGTETYTTADFQQRIG